MAIRISNFYRHILQCDWGCIKIFHHRNIIIVRRVVFGIKLFIVVCNLRFDYPDLFYALYFQNFLYY